MANPCGVPVRGIVRGDRRLTDAISREPREQQLESAAIGVSPSPGEELSLGQVAAELLDPSRMFSPFSRQRASLENRTLPSPSRVQSPAYSQSADRQESTAPVACPEPISADLALLGQ